MRWGRPDTKRMALFGFGRKGRPACTQMSRRAHARRTTKQASTASDTAIHCTASVSIRNTGYRPSQPSPAQPSPARHPPSLPLSNPAQHSPPTHAPTLPPPKAACPIAATPRSSAQPHLSYTQRARPILHTQKKKKQGGQKIRVSF